MVYFVLSGRKIDKNGNYRNWWSDSSDAEYNNLTSCFVDLYGREVVAGVNVSSMPWSEKGLTSKNPIFHFFI